MRLDWAALVTTLHQAERVVLTSHVRPDCDALGSELGMAAQEAMKEGGAVPDEILIPLVTEKLSSPEVAT